MRSINFQNLYKLSSSSAVLYTLGMKHLQLTVRHNVPCYAIHRRIILILDLE